MAQPLPEERSTLDQVLRLVDKLTPKERFELQRRLDIDNWGEEWDRLSAKIQARFAAAGESIPSEEEVMAEVKAVRNERKDRRAESGN